MIDPYLAVALQTKVKHVKTRNEVQVNLDHIGNMIEMVTHMCSLELPVRLIALGEGAIQGFVDEILDMNQAEYAKTMAAEIPGPETDFLGKLAKEKGTYIIGQLKEKLPEYKDRFFNTIFIIDENGDVIYKHHKNIVVFVEHSTTPHDVYDQWVEQHGDSIEAFFPVAKTPIGNIAGTVGVEGSFPESFRAFALNGAEILYRASLPEPWVSREIFEVQNRSRAIDNTAYMIAPNTGSLIMPSESGGDPTIIDGALGGRSSINIEALRHYRQNARFQNWIPYLKTEIFKKLYDRPIWPSNLPPMNHDDAGNVFNDSIKKLIKSGIYTEKSKK